MFIVLFHLICVVEIFHNKNVGGKGMYALIESKIKFCSMENSGSMKNLFMSLSS